MNLYVCQEGGPLSGSYLACHCMGTTTHSFKNILISIVLVLSWLAYEAIVVESVSTMVP